MDFNLPIKNERKILWLIDFILQFPSTGKSHHLPGSQCQSITSGWIPSSAGILIVLHRIFRSQILKRHRRIPGWLL